jgi:uroporphyrinogen decarboxylase
MANQSLKTDILSNRKRVLLTLSHQQADKVPYHIAFTQVARQKMIDFYSESDFEAKLGNCFTVIQGRPKYLWKQIHPDIWQDDFGSIWNRTRDKDIGVVENCLITPRNVNIFEFPNPDDMDRYRLFDEQIRNSCGFVVVNLGISLFERAWVMAGMENLLMAMIADKVFAHALFDRILEFNLDMIENFCRFDIDAILLGDDWGHQNGVIIGYPLWKEFVQPRIAQMYDLVKSKGKFVFIHSCGKVQELFPELIECGLDVFNPFQPEVMDVAEMKQKFGDKLAFFGGISTQQTLPFGTVSQVKDEIKRLIDVVGKNGGYIASPAHSIPGDAKAENIAAMIDVLQNQ